MFHILHCGVSYVSYNMFPMLHEMMSILVIRDLCDFIYENLLKQIKFGKYKLYSSKCALCYGIKN